MSLHLNKRSILKYTAQVGGLTFLSRVLGIIREALLVRFFGVGALCDAFLTAFRIPNTLRHIFAEGALSASFVPAFVKSVKNNDREEANGLMTLSFIFFEGILLFLYAFVLFKTELVIRSIAPGFSAEQTAYAIPFLRLLFPIILIISSSSLLAGALQSMNHFFIPAFGTPLWNIIYVATLVFCMFFKLPAAVLCGGILLGAFAGFLLHVHMYYSLGFKFGRITQQSWDVFRAVLTKFFPGLLGVGIIEINLFVSGIFASFLPEGSITLLYFGQRFMNVPIGMFAVAFSSILLPHFSRVTLYAPKRLNFYILEATKFVSWVIIPTILFLMFCSENIFITFLGSKATSENIFQAKWILISYLCGLLFLCLNKVLLNVFYAMKDTAATSMAVLVSASINILADIIGIYFFGVYGIAAANTLAGFSLTLMCFYLLRKRHQFRFYAGNYFNFLGRYILQLFIAVGVFIVAYATIMHRAITSPMGQFSSTGLGYWLIVPSLALVCMIVVFISRKRFGVELYFLNK